jgi:hypothetical protein
LPSTEREADNAHLGPRNDFVIKAAYKVDESAALEVARPLRTVGGWIPKARDPIKGGFDVSAQRSAYNGVSVEDEVSEVPGDPFDHHPRLEHPALDVNGLAACVRLRRHGVYGGTLLICSTSFFNG